MNTAEAATRNATGGVESLAFLAFPASRSAEQVSSTTEEVARGIAVLLGQVIADVLASRTSAEFRQVRDSQLGRYMQLMIALGGLVGASVEQNTIERLTHESLYEMEEQFRAGGPSLGDDLAEQAQFTTWTLGKIHDLVQECNAKTVPGNLAEADQVFAQEYVRHVLFARFHLDCLRMALVTNQPLFPEPRQEIAEGLRATVDAYAWVRQGRDLRLVEREELPFEMPWDEDQEELLQLSTADMLRENYG